LITFILALAIKNNVIINPDTAADAIKCNFRLLSLSQNDGAAGSERQLLQTRHISAFNYLVLPAAVRGSLLDIEEIYYTKI